MKIYFKTLLGQTLPLDGVEGWHDIGQLKTLAHAWYGFIPRETRFIFAGKDLY